MNLPKYLFLDESGDTGFQFGQQGQKAGSSVLFHLILLRIATADDLTRCRECLAEIRRVRGLPQDFEFHSKKCPDKIRDFFLSKIQSLPFDYLWDTFDKRSHQGHHKPLGLTLYSDGLTRLLQGHELEIESAQLIFDRHDSAPFNQELSQICRSVVGVDESGKPRIKNVRPAKSEKEDLIQLADMVLGCCVRNECPSWLQKRCVRRTMQPAKSVANSVTGEGMESMGEIPPEVR
jgi:hypothetical protein